MPQHYEFYPSVFVEMEGKRIGRILIILISWREVTAKEVESLAL